MQRGSHRGWFIALRVAIKPTAFIVASFALFFSYMHSHLHGAVIALKRTLEVHHFNVFTATDKHNIRWRPAGTALVCTAISESIPWEPDIDICVHPDDCLAAHKLLGLKAVDCPGKDWNEAQGDDFNIYAIAWGGPGIHRDASWHGNLLSEVHLDVFVCLEDRAEWNTPQEDVSICGQKYKVHNGTLADMKRWYGNGWALPSPYPNKGDYPSILPN